MVQNNKSDGSRLTVNRVFGEAAALVAKASGQPAAFATAAAVVIVWAASGPIFHYSDH
jgi:low affinity Fe/Cu permease